MTISLDKIKSVPDVLQALNKLSKNCPPQFALFNQAYLIVTQNIDQAAKADAFNNRQFIEDFSVRFAKHYFAAVNQTTNRDPKIAEAWQAINQLSHGPAFIPLLMGANAHINHDLPLALLGLNGRRTDDLLPDIAKVDKLLMKSGKQIIAAFSEPNQRLDFIKRHFQFVYYRPAMYMILYWRILAWHRYQQLRRGRATTANFDNYSPKIARRFAWLNHRLGSS